MIIPKATPETTLSNFLTAILKKNKITKKEFFKKTKLEKSIFQKETELTEEAALALQKFTLVDYSYWIELSKKKLE